MSDPYRHHPGLRGKIRPADESFFRDFSIIKMRAIAEEKNLPVDWWYTDEVREAHRVETMAGRMGHDLWIFGFGSLMWDPAMEFAEVRRARVDGFSRQFIFKEMNGGRGTEDCPGLIAALDHGGACDGLAFRVAREHVDRETEILWRREFICPGYLATFVQADTDHGTVEALTFVADHSVPEVIPDLDRATQVEWFAEAEGFLGTSFDYLEGIAVKLRELQIHDAEVEALYAEVVARRGTRNT